MMVRGLLTCFVLALACAGCFKGRSVTLIDGDEIVASSVEFVTSALFVESLEQLVREKREAGVDVSVRMHDGEARISWQEEGFPFAEEPLRCRGFWFWRTCRFAHSEEVSTKSLSVELFWQSYREHTEAEEEGVVVPRMELVLQFADEVEIIETSGEVEATEGGQIVTWRYDVVPGETLDMYLEYKP